MPRPHPREDKLMTKDQLEARLRATEIALDCLLAEIDELRDRLEAHARICPNGEINLD